MGKFFCKYPKCEYRTYNKPTFERHIIKHNDYLKVTAQTQTYVCDYEGCDKEFASKQTWINHRYNYHQCKLRCTHPGCDFTTTYNATLKRHEIKHSNDRPFVCEVEGCGKRFKRVRNYTKHLDIHKNKFFKCTFEGCDKTYETGPGLLTHQQSAHIKDTLYVCEWPGCEFKTYNRNNYRGHQAVHSDQKFLCDYPNCNSKYKHVYDLRHHQLKHHGIGQGYECSWPGCQHKAITEYKLKIHEKSHNKDK